MKTPIKTANCRFIHCSTSKYPEKMSTILRLLALCHSLSGQLLPHKWWLKLFLSFALFATHCPAGQLPHDYAWNHDTIASHQHNGVAQKTKKMRWIIRRTRTRAPYWMNAKVMRVSENDDHRWRKKWHRIYGASRALPSSKSTSAIIWAIRVTVIRKLRWAIFPLFHFSNVHLICIYSFGGARTQCSTMPHFVPCSSVERPLVSRCQWIRGVRKIANTFIQAPANWIDSRHLHGKSLLSSCDKFPRIIELFARSRVPLSCSDFIDLFCRIIFPIRCHHWTLFFALVLITS